MLATDEGCDFLSEVLIASLLEEVDELLLVDAFVAVFIHGIEHLSDFLVKIGR